MRLGHTEFIKLQEAIIENARATPNGLSIFELKKLFPEVKSATLGRAWRQLEGDKLLRRQGDKRATRIFYNG